MSARVLLRSVLVLCVVLAALAPGAHGATRPPMPYAWLDIASDTAATVRWVPVAGATSYEVHLDGTPVTFEGDGLLARCLQHETDHTLGTVFGDRLSSKSRKKLTKKHDAAAEDYPLSWPADTAG